MYQRVRRARKTTVGLSIVLLAMLSTEAQATLAEINCTGSPETIPITMPNSITVPRDAVVGQVISEWVQTAPNQNFYQCQANDLALSLSGSERHASGVAFRHLSLTKANLSVQGSRGASYTVWNTNVSGVGIAIGVNVYTQGAGGNRCGWMGWRSIDVKKSFLPYPWTGEGCTVSTRDTSKGGQVEVALVKTGPVSTGTVTGGVLFEGASITGRHINGPYTIASEGRKSFLVSSTAINLAACSTANVMVDLGSHKQSNFKGIGSTTPAADVNIGLSSCPAGLNAIQYQFTPLTAILDGSNGVLALSADSTATGIGVQVKDRNGSPLKFNTPYTLANYDKTTGGTYTIPLTASYYQTSSPVKPGTANSLLTFTMSYQ